MTQYIPPKECVHVREWIRVKFFSLNIIIGESIKIYMQELNKVHDMDM